MSGPLKKAGGTAAKAALRAPRAVTAAEASKIEPSREPSKETMMPWNGWFSSFLRDKLGEERYDKIRRLVLYRPDDVHALHQIPNPSTKVRISKDDPTVTTQFRYPSPGSQDPVRIPTVDAGEDPYDTAYYKRDTKRRGLDPAFPHPEIEQLKLELLPQDDPNVQELKEKLQEGPKSSPGNKGTFATGKTDFDPTGLRASMSANHAALEKSLDAHMPDHLPEPVWWENQDEIVAWYEERGLPVPIGQTGFGTVPVAGRVAKW